MFLYASEEYAVVGLKQVFILFNLRFWFCVHVLNITDTYMKIGMCADLKIDMRVDQMIV